MQQRCLHWIQYVHKRNTIRRCVDISYKWWNIAEGRILLGTGHNSCRNEGLCLDSISNKVKEPGKVTSHQPGNQSWQLAGVGRGEDVPEEEIKQTLLTCCSCFAPASAVQQVQALPSPSPDHSFPHLCSVVLMTVVLEMCPSGLINHYPGPPDPH